MPWPIQLLERGGQSSGHLGPKPNRLENALPHPGASQAPAQASPQPSRGKESLRVASPGTEGLSPAGFCLKVLRSLIWATQKQELPRVERTPHCSAGARPGTPARDGGSAALGRQRLRRLGQTEWDWEEQTARK